MRQEADAIPPWNSAGVVPAHNLAAPTSRDRSPYAVSLFDIVTHFGNTEARRYLLQKWLDFRAALYQVDIQEGFQWIDGSFVENIEQVSGRPPNDIDVVTFFYIPDGYTGAALYQRSPRLFDSEFVKDRYAIDAYFVQLNHARAEEIIEQSIYWYSIWSHTRTGQWKGYLQVDLSPSHDATARVKLETGRQ